MTGTRPISRPADRAVLIYLRDLVVGDGGYEIGRVRGWAAESDVVKRAGCKSARPLPNLHQHGFVSREDVRIRGVVEASWVYRISELGARAAGGIAGAPPVHVVPAVMRSTVPAVYLPHEHLVVHLVLRACWDDPEIGERFGGNGWVLLHESEQRLVAFNDCFGSPLAPTDPRPSLDWLEARGLVHWAHAEVTEGQAPDLSFWRPTTAGVHMIPLLWREPGRLDTDPRWDRYLSYFPFRTY